MGYTIIIGNAEIEQCDPDEYEGQLVARYDIPVVRHDEAPASGDPTDCENQRWPSYRAWSDFAEDVGLYDTFFSPDYGIMRAHPGCFQLKVAHLQRVEIAIAEQVRNPSNDVYNMARLQWLRYWIDWALKNCDNPAIYNS